MDLVIRNGLLVTATGSRTADLAIAGGRIAAVGMGLQGEREIDATGLYVMPGAIDPHTHLDEPYGDDRTSDDFYTGTVAAAAGGVTTLINFATQQPGQGLLETLQGWQERAAGQAVIDYGFHLAVIDWHEGLEAEAVGRAIALAEVAGAPLYIVHNSCRAGVELIDRARQRGLPVYGETCPQYLGILDATRYDGPPAEATRFICSPPLRPREEAAHLWEALQSGVLDLVSSDHCPYNLVGGKDRGAQDFTRAPNGLPTIETRLPLIHHEGVRKGRITLSRMVELLATAPARLFGLYPRKGSLEPGADADLVLFDPRRRVTIRHDDLHERVDHTPYEGVEVEGWPVMTIARGEVIWAEGRFQGEPGRGRFLPRPPLYHQKERGMMA